MKIALVHDYLREFGGAERVLVELSNMFPEAPIYTAFKVDGASGGRAFKGKKVVESKYSFLVKHFNLYSPLRFLAPAIWKSFDLSSYDLVIASSSWYITKGFRVGDKTKVVCYCHTPPRYLYGFRTSLAWRKFFLVRWYGMIINHFLRIADFKGASQVDEFLANSENVKKRIRKFYKKESRVVYPPCESEKIEKATRGYRVGDYFLVVSRVVGAKGIEMVCEAAKKAKVKVKIVGEAGGFRFGKKDVKRLSSEWVEFVGRVSDDELYKYYGECRGFLATSYDEDFGITVVEAMAAGRPVLAYRGGGYLETVVEGKTGEFFDEYSVESLALNLKRFDERKYNSEECRRQARKFSKDKFEKKVREVELGL